MSLETCAACATRYAVGLQACPHCRSTERAVDASAVVPTMADTACTNTVCGSAGLPRRVVLPRPTPGVVELPTLLCAACGHVLPLAWPGPVESDGDAMSPKITRHGGASNKHDPENAAATATEPTPEAAADQPEPLDVTEHMAGPARPVEVRGEHGPELVEMEGGEESSPGSNSSTSTEKPSPTPEPSKPTPRKRTRAANRSTKARTENSSASSPDIGGPETDAPTDDEASADETGD